MSGLKEIVQSRLRIKQVSPEIITSIDTLIQSAVIDLQRNDLLPSRTIEFTSLDRKQEKRDSDNKVLYNFYYLPNDFRKLDTFYPRTNNPYNYTNKKQDLYNSASLTLSQQALLQKQFGIFDDHIDEDTKSKKILIAYPFPDDDETIEIRYFSNGANQNWDWIDEIYWEVIISWIYRELGLRSTQDLEDDLGRAVSTHKEDKGHNMENGTFVTLKGSYFGKRGRNLYGNRYTKRRTTIN